MDNDNTPHAEPIADADLVLRTRSGDAAAFGELWRRHYSSGMSVARSITSSIDPDDLVQESYTRIYQAILKGGGPNGSFRAYLFTSIRNTAAAWGRSRRETAIDELDAVADPDSTEQATDDALDRSLTAQAFRSLPSRWQEVLWYTEIERMKPQEVGPLLGMKAGAVSQLAFRAREGLREAWIRVHLSSAADGSDCQWTIEHLGAHSRGNLSARDRKRLEQHLGDCARCMIVAAEAKDVSNRLALVLLPLVLGVSGSAGYLATLQGGGTPIVALAAMPSGVTEGAVVVGGTGTTGGVAGSGTPVGGAGPSSRGVFSRAGSLVGAGSAVLVVAAVVAAVAIIPGLAGASPAASLPNASDSDPGSISSDIAPDDTMSLTEPVIIEAPIPTPTPEPETPVDEALVPAVPGRTAPATAPPTVTPAPSEIPDAETPSVEVPAEEVPEEELPEEEVPEEEVPVLPEGVPTFVSATVECAYEGLELLPVTHYWVVVSGAPGAKVQPLLAGSAAGTTGDELDAAGNGLVDIRPTFMQLILNAPVQFQYSAVDAAGNTVVGEPSAAQRIISLADPTGVACGGEGAPAAETPAAAPAPIEDQVPITEPAPATESAPAPAPAVEPAPSPAVEPEPAPALEPAPAPAQTPPAATEQPGLLSTTVDSAAAAVDAALPPL